MGEERGFTSAGTWVNFYQAGHRGEGVWWDEGSFETGGECWDGRCCLFDVGFG